MKVKIIFKIGLDRAYGCDRSHNSDQFGPDCGRTRGLSAQGYGEPIQKLVFRVFSTQMLNWDLPGPIGRFRTVSIA